MNIVTTRCEISF